MDKDLVGKVVHYYDKIGVAVVALKKNLKVGDKVKFEKGDNSFEQEVSSMQLEHKPITQGKSGQEVAIKIEQVAKEGAFVYFV